VPYFNSLNAGNGREFTERKILIQGQFRNG